MELFDFETSLTSHPDVISVKEIDLLTLPKRVAHRKPDFSKAFIATVQVGILNYKLLICKPKGFPKNLPYIHLANPEQHDFHNHVNYEGEVCYTARSTDVFIEVEKPEAVLHQALNLAIDTLDSSSDRDLTELQEEFEGYWVSLPGCKKVQCFFNPGTEPERIKAYCNPKANRAYIPVTFYQGPLPKHYGYQAKLKRLQSRNAWYIPLEKATLPPPPDSRLTPRYVRGLLEYVAAPDKERLKKELTIQKKKKKTKERHHSELILFSQPRPSGMLALFGVAITGYSKLTFFGDDDESRWTVTPLSIRRHYDGYVLERGGAVLSLKKKTVAVIGCGAVGSRIVEQLALCGVGHIIIVDNDIMSEDNIFRHVLGGGAIDDKKAEAMADHLKCRLPYIDVSSKPAARDSWLSEDGWSEVQLIVDATADFTGMCDMNKDIVKSSSPVPVVYTWLEACGIGGHALLVNGTSKGCLECLLKHNEQGPYRLCDFLEPFQNITKDLTGCAGAYTPFSALDSIKTATIATDLAVERLLSDTPSSYRFWVGSDAIAKSAGLRTSDWYNKANNGEVENVERGFVQPRCSVCGGLT